MTAPAVSFPPFPLHLRSVPPLQAEETQVPRMAPIAIGGFNPIPGDAAKVLDQISNAVKAVDWYDDCGPEFVAPAVETVARAKSFVDALAIAAAKLGRRLPVPDFSPAADGSVDIHWGDNESRELLLGIRTSGNVASYFGQCSDGTSIKGALRIDAQNEFLAAWLTSQS